MATENENSIYFPSEINPDQLSLTTLKVNAKGGSVANLSYKKKFLLVQGPEMYSPFGVNAYTGKEGNDYHKPSIDLQCSFGVEPRQSLDELKTFIGHVDRIVIDAIVKDSYTWTGKHSDPADPVSRVIANSKYKSSITISKDKQGRLLDFPPTFRVKLPYNQDTGEFTFKLYDEEGNEKNLNDYRVNDPVAKKISFPATKGGKFIPIFKISIWKSQNVACTCQLVQLQMTLPKRLTGNAIRRNPAQLMSGDAPVEPDDTNDTNDAKVNTLTQSVGGLNVVDSDDDQ